MAQEGWPASASCARTGRRATELERFRLANLEYLDRNRGLIKLQGVLLSEHVAVPRPRRAARALARQPRGDPRTDHDRRVRRVQLVSRHAELADDRVRLGDEHAPARAWRRGSACSRCSKRSRSSPTCTVRREPTLAVQRDRDQTPHLRLRRRSAGAARRLAAASSRGRPRRSSARPGPASRRCSTCFRVCTSRRPARCSSTASTSGRSRSRCCAARSGSFRRNRSSSRTRSRTTCCSAWTRQGTRRHGSRQRPHRAPRQGRRARSRRATTAWSASAASRSQAVRNSGRRWRARSRSIRAILVLDDALSAVDTYTEEEILSRLRDVMRQRTSIIVSHRVSTVRDADQIFVLDEGRIVERGSHDELVRRDGAVCGVVPEAAPGRGTGGQLRCHSTRKRYSARRMTRG